jgi:hypothetical protein
MEAEARHAGAEVPVEDRGLDGDGEEGSKPEMRGEQQGAQFRPPKHPEGVADAEEDAIVFGEGREAEQRRRQIEPAPVLPAVFPIVREAMEGVKRGEGEEDQQMVVEGDATEDGDGRDGDEDDQRVPEPALAIMRGEPGAP